MLGHITLKVLTRVNSIIEERDKWQAQWKIRNLVPIYNSTCPKSKLDFWGFQMFPAFLSCLKLSLGCALALSGLRFVGTSKARNFFNWSVPALRSHSHSHMRKSHVCRVVSSIEWLFSMFRLFHLCDSLINFIQFHHPCEILWIWNSNFSTRHRRFSGSLARWCVSLSLHAIGGYWPKVSSWPRLWCLMSFIDLIHSDSVNLLLYFPLTWFRVSGVLVHAFICFLTWHQRFCGTGSHGQNLSTFRIRMSRAEFQAVGSLFSSKQCEKYLDPPSVLFASMNLVDRITSGVILVLVSIRRARSQAANQERGPRQPSGRSVRMKGLDLTDDTNGWIGSRNHIKM